MTDVSSVTSMSFMDQALKERREAAKNPQVVIPMRELGPVSNKIRL